MSLGSFFRDSFYKYVDLEILTQILIATQLYL